MATKYLVDHLEMEFEAHIWCFSRAHEYYKTIKFQLKTPSLMVPKSIFRLFHRIKSTDLLIKEINC